MLSNALFRRVSSGRLVGLVSTHQLGTRAASVSHSGGKGNGMPARKQVRGGMGRR